MTAFPSTMQEADARARALFDAKATAAVFAGTTALVIAAMYLLARIGLETSYLVVLLSVGLGLLLLCLPSGYLLLAHRFHIDTHASWLRSDTFIGLLGIGAVVLAGLPGPLPGLGIVLAVVGWGLFGYVVGHWWLMGRARVNLLWLVGTVFLAAGLICLVWLSGFLHPLSEEQMRARLVDAAVATDTLFHMAISSMIQTYGIPSTGLDGLPYLNYHIGSHWVFAQVSNVLDTTPFTFYLLCYPVIFVPLLLYALLSLAIDVRFTFLAEPGRPLRSDGLFWVLLVVALVMPFGLRDGIYIRVASYLISESYNLSLTLACLLCASGVIFYRSNRATWQRPWEHRARETLSYAVWAVLALGMLGMIKVSLMVLFVLVALYLFVRLRLYTNFVFLVALPVLISVCMIVVYMVTYPSLEANGFVPFHYVENFVQPAWRPYFFLAGFGFVWLLLAIKVYTLRLITPRRLLAAWKDQRSIDVEVVLILALVGVLPAVLLPIPGGSALFFWDVQRWVALALVLGQLPYGYAPLRDLQSLAARLLWQPLCKLLQPARLVLWLARWSGHALRFAVVALFCWLLLQEGSELLRVAFFQNLYIRSAILGNEGAYYRAEDAFYAGDYTALLAELATLHTIGEGHFPMDDTFARLRALPQAEKARTALFIPQSNRQYWELFSICAKVPFAAPALSGLAMLDGLPRDCPRLFYGYWTYPPPVQSTAATATAADGAALEVQATDPDTLCAAARSKGFSRIIVFATNAEQAPVTSTLSCAPRQE